MDAPIEIDVLVFSEHEISYGPLSTEYSNVKVASQLGNVFFHSLDCPTFEVRRDPTHFL